MIESSLAVDFFKSWLKRGTRRSHRSAIRNYRIFRNNGELDTFLYLRRSLYSANFNEKSLGLCNVLMPKNIVVTEIHVRQLLNHRRHFLGIQKRILISKHRFRYAIPPEWSSIIQDLGFKADKLTSTAYWYTYVFFLGVFAIANSLKELLPKKHGSNWNTAKTVAHFCRLQPQCVPTNENKGGITIFDWYASRKLKVPDNIPLLTHAAFPHKERKFGKMAVKGLGSDLPPLTIINAFILIFWCLSMFLLGLADILRGKWVSLFILHEALLAKKMALVPSKYLAREYLFSHEACTYKPLWTDVVEQRGSLCSVYFYSTNSHDVVPPYKQQDFYLAFLYMTWSRYLVWNKKQKKQILKSAENNPNIEKSKFEIVGPIPTMDKPFIFKKSRKPSLAIFDVSPSRLSFYVTLARQYEYYVPKTVKNFLLSIEEIRDELNFEIHFKMKRHQSSLTDRSYKKLIERLINGGWNMVDPEVNASHLIAHTNASIHFPFTSTALIAEKMGKPAIYFDPTGKLGKNNTAMLGSGVALSKLELKTFVQASLSKC